jgi:hypothetical protein
MPLLDLSDVGDDLAVYLQFAIEQAEAAPDPASLAAAAMSVSSHYEALALTELLLDANTDAFVHHLIRSAQTRLWLFDRVEHSAETAKATKASYLRPFVDALACGAWDLAREVASRETDVWAERTEYEDDFCYARALHLLVQGQTQAAMSLLDRYEAVLEGAAQPRLDLCRVLLAPDPDSAEDAFHALLDQHTARIDAMKEDSSYWDGSDSLLYPNVFVFTEGLAWLTLLERAGMAMTDEYRYCPSLARHVQAGPFAPTAFPFRPL